MATPVKEPQVLYDARGRKSYILMPYNRYKKMLEFLEEAIDLKATKKVKLEKTLPWKEVKRKLNKRSQ